MSNPISTPFVTSIESLTTRRPSASGSLAQPDFVSPLDARPQLTPLAAMTMPLQLIDQAAVAQQFGFIGTNLPQHLPFQTGVSSALAAFVPAQRQAAHGGILQISPVDPNQMPRVSQVLIAQGSGHLLSAAGHPPVAGYMSQFPLPQTVYAEARLPEPSFGARAESGNRGIGLGLGRVPGAPNSLQQAGAPAMTTLFGAGLGSSGVPGAAPSAFSSARRATGSSVGSAVLRSTGEAESPTQGAGKNDGAGPRDERPYKPKKCEHGRQKNKCVECRGAGICEHNRLRRICKVCGGNGICEHNRQRNICRDCKGSQICDHLRRRSRCKDCGGGQICEHGRRRSRCKECRGSEICEHERERRLCMDCRGTGICKHLRQRRFCKECKATAAAAEGPPGAVAAAGGLAAAATAALVERADGEG